MKKDTMIIAFGNDSPINQAMAKFYGLYAKKAGISESSFFSVIDHSMSDFLSIREFIDVCNGLFSSTWNIVFLPLNIFGTDNDENMAYEAGYLQRLKDHYVDKSVRIMTWNEFVSRFKPVP